MALRLPPFHPLPPPKGGKNALLEVPIQDLHPTQLCVGMAEIVSRQRDFAEDDPKEQRQYLKRKPTPLVRSAAGELWMVDRHHRLRALLELDPQATAFGYVALEVDSADPAVVLADEPTGNLDSARSREIMELLGALNRERGITVVMITHEADMAAYAERVVHFLDGLVARDARPARAG